jgi:hypothetical protein
MSMKTSSSWLADRTVVAVKPNGEEIQVIMRIGFPYEVSPDQWACQVAVDGLHDSLQEQSGIDAWQAVQLAQSLQAQLLGYFVEDGGELFWPKTREPLELSDLFPKVPTTNVKR